MSIPSKIPPFIRENLKVGEICYIEQDFINKVVLGVFLRILLPRIVQNKISKNNKMIYVNKIF